MDPPEAGSAASVDRAYTFDDVSVAMATYNEEAAIERVLDDVDDGTDGRAEVVEDPFDRGLLVVGGHHHAHVVERVDLTCGDGWIRIGGVHRTGVPVEGA